MKGWKVRQEKVMYGGMWANKRTYIMNGKLIGTILKNPYNGLYEVTASDFINESYVNREFKKFADAKQFMMRFQMLQIQKGIRDEGNKIMRL